MLSGVVVFLWKAAKSADLKGLRVLWACVTVHIVVQVIGWHRKRAHAHTRAVEGGGGGAVTLCSEQRSPGGQGSGCNE